MSQQTIRPISERQRRDIFVVTPLQNAAQLRRSDIDAAPTELGLFCGEHSTKMPRLRRSAARAPKTNARLAPIGK